MTMTMTMAVTFICCVSLPLNNQSGSMLTIACSVANADSGQITRYAFGWYPYTIPGTTSRCKPIREDERGEGSAGNQFPSMISIVMPVNG